MNSIRGNAILTGNTARQDIRPSASTSHLLQDIGPSDVVEQPYPHYISSHALADDAYAVLEEEFPALETILDGRNYANNQAVRMTVKQVLSDRRISPLWREFFDYHTGKDYWRDVVRVFGERFRREFPGLEERVGRHYEDWRVVPRGFSGDADLHLDCQFVMNTPVTAMSRVKTTHIDLSDKIFSALFYFRDQADASSGSDFEIYRWRREPRFIKHRVMNRDVEVVKTVKYGPNTYACFLNSPHAVHAVSPRSITQVPRRYINFIAELPFKAFKTKQLNRLQRFWHREEVQTASQERY
jgi:hypothetical protein